MRRGKHASRRIKFFASTRGKHAKDELIVYNPVYAKFSACISSLAVTTSLFACLSLGKYKETLATSDISRVSKCLLNLTSAQTSITEFIPETTRSFNFNVSNFEGNIDNPTSKNEVSLKYLLNIEIPTTTNIPFKYKLYRTDNGTDENIELINGKTDWIEVDRVSKVHTYRLDFMWEQNETDLRYENLTDDVNISLEYEQIDNN